MNGEGQRLHVAVRVCHQEQEERVVDIRWILFYMRREKKDPAVDPPGVRQTGGNLRDEHEPILLVFFAIEKAEELPEFLVLFEGAQVVARVGGRAARAQRGDRGPERQKGEKTSHHCRAARVAGTRMVGNSMWNCQAGGALP